MSWLVAAASAAEAEINVSSQARLLALAAGVGIAFVVLELVRRHKLQTRYTVSWIVAAIVLALLGAVPELLRALADLVGIADTTAAFFAATLAIGAALLLNLTSVVSQQSEQITRLAQELAIQREEAEAAEGARSERERPS